jgi:hypothetical protein
VTGVQRGWRQASLNNVGAYHARLGEYEPALTLRVPKTSSALVTADLIRHNEILSWSTFGARQSPPATGVDPRLVCYHKASRLKQYFKEGRALRTETVIDDTRDFGVGRRLNAANWNALRAVGTKANQRLCDAQAADAQPAPDMVTLHQVTRPSHTSDGQRTPALRFGDPRGPPSCRPSSASVTSSPGSTTAPSPP